MLLADPCDDFLAGIYPIQDSRIRLLGQDAGARLVALEPLDAFNIRLNSPEGQDVAHAIIEFYGSLLVPGPVQENRRTGFALYLNGEIGKLMAWNRHANAAFFGAGKGEALYRRAHGYLVEERNVGFVERALPLLEDGNAVLAVGAFHLPGRHGLVTRLRNAGFAVTRVPVEGETR